MRVKLNQEGEESVLCKFDGDLEALLTAAETKLGWRPASMSVGGARLTSVEDLEFDDEVLCERQESRKRPADSATSSSAKATTEENADPQNESLTIKVVDKDGVEVFFKVKPKTKVQKILKAFEERLGLTLGTLRFTFDGKRLPHLGRPSDDTIEYWEMEDGDSIDAHHEATGGRLAAD